MAYVKSAAVLLLALLYAGSPIDVIPDVIPIAGWIDDVGVIGLACSMISGFMSETSETKTA